MVGDRISALHVALISLVACIDGGPPPWGPGPITPIGDQRWFDQVLVASDAWNEAGNCALLSLVHDDAHQVILDIDPDWPSDVMGRFDGEAIHIRAGLDSWELPILMHEIGHAIGLNHISVVEDPDSVMLSPSSIEKWMPSDGDGARVSEFCP